MIFFLSNHFLKARDQSYFCKKYLKRLSKCIMIFFYFLFRCDMLFLSSLLQVCNNSTCVYCNNFISIMFNFKTILKLSFHQNYFIYMILNKNYIEPILTKINSNNLKSKQFLSNHYFNPVITKAM